MVNEFHISMSRMTCLVAGVRAAQQNLVPMLVLWGLSVALVGLYYRVDGVAEILSVVANWQTRSGSIAAMLNRLFFGGILPGVFTMVCTSLRPRRPVLVIVAMSTFSGVLGLACEAMYMLNARLFGEGIDVITLAEKTLVAQFVWTPLFFCPLSAVFASWVGGDFSFQALREKLAHDFVRTDMLPNLVSNWLVWIPAMFAVHAFPTPLQIQLSGLVGAFWVLMLMALGRNAGRNASSAIVSSSSPS